MDRLHACAYLSRVVAEALFDDVSRSPGQPSGTHAATIDTSLLPARTVRTRLGSAIPGAGVSVDVELVPWSRSRTEVAVRYAGTRQPRALACYVYDKRAPLLLEDVTGAINARLPGSTADRRAA